jgi:hypothetical protein
MKGVANLSAGRVCCKFMGMVGTEATAEAYRRKMEQQGVQPVLLVRLRNAGFQLQWSRFCATHPVDC